MTYTRAPRVRSLLQATLAFAFAQAGQVEKAVSLARTAAKGLYAIPEDEFLPIAWYHVAKTLELADRWLAGRALHAAYTALQAQCLHVPEEHHATFLRTVYPNYLIVKAWLDHMPRPVERLYITLPAREGDAHIPVVWTLDNGDEDAIIEAIQGPVAARRHRLARLLREAERQGARVPHRVLAEVLRVSLPTIQRDLRTLPHNSTNARYPHHFMNVGKVRV